MPLLAWLHALDLQALYLINVTWSRPWLDPVLARVSDFNSWRVPLALAVAAALVFGRFRGRLLLAMMALALVVGDGMIDWGFKLAVHRPRPMEAEPHLRVVTVGEVAESAPHPTTRGRSFTSGHVCNNVALAMMATAIFGRAAWFLWPWALLVGWSRVYCGSHYPSDVLGSWVVAVLYSWALLALAEKAWARWGPRRLPQLHAAHPVLFPGRANRRDGWTASRPAAD